MPSVDAPPQVPATASQAGSGGYKASVSTSELMGEDGGAQPGPQEGILIAKEISKTQNSRKTTPNYVTTCTSYKLLDKKTAAAVRKIPNVGPNLPKSGNNLKPPVAKPSSTKRKVLPKKRASLGVQTDRSEVQSEPCALCEAAQTARPEVTYIKERNSDQKKRTRETERAHRSLKFCTRKLLNKNLMAVMRPQSFKSSVISSQSFIVLFEFWRLNVFMQQA